MEQDAAHGGSYRFYATGGFRMTHTHRPLFPRNRRQPSPRPTAGQVCFCLLSTFCFLLILRNSEAAIRYMGRGLSLCAGTVIPSLFPFMVISELLVKSGAGEAFGRLFSRVMRWVFGISGAGVSAVILGSMCGFPIGARTAVSLYDENLISKSECEHLLTFTNNPSSAFLITAVGVSVFGNRRMGVVLYGVVLGSAFLVGFLARFFLRGSGRPCEHPHHPSGLRPVGVEIFTSAISGAASGMLTVCAYVIFFSALTGALGSMLAEGGGSGETGYILLCGFLELTGGISEASGHASAETAVILAALVAGWSGLSVHCQVLSLCGGRGLSFKPYFIAKAAQAVLSAAVMAGLLRFGDPAWFSAGETSVMSGTLGEALRTVRSIRDISVPALIGDGAFIVGWLLSEVGRWRRST